MILYEQAMGFYPPVPPSATFLLSPGGVGNHGLNALANSFASLGLSTNVSNILIGFFLDTKFIYFQFFSCYILVDTFLI